MSDKLPDLNWQGVVAAVLALSFGTCLVAIVLDVTIGSNELSPGGQQIIAALMGGVLGALSTYLGYSVRTRNPPDPQDPGQ